LLTRDWTSGSDGKDSKNIKDSKDGPKMTPGTPPTAAPSFGARLRVAMDGLGPLCAGIDPHPALLAHWGLDDTAQGLEAFAMTCVEAFAGTVAIVKPQSAFFERFGSAGVAVLERTLAGLREAGTLSLLDVKRGDIGSTMTAYAQAYLSPESTLRADASRSARSSASSPCVRHWISPARAGVACSSWR